MLRNEYLIQEGGALTDEIVTEANEAIIVSQYSRPVDPIGAASDGITEGIRC